MKDSDGVDMGPNVSKLFIHCLALIAVPVGGKGFEDGLAFLSTKESVAEGGRKATDQIRALLARVKAAPDNPYGNDDEVIAGRILAGIEERKAQQRAASGGVR